MFSPYYCYLLPPSFPFSHNPTPSLWATWFSFPLLPYYTLNHINSLQLLSFPEVVSLPLSFLLFPLLLVLFKRADLLLFPTSLDLTPKGKPFTFPYFFCSHFRGQTFYFSLFLLLSFQRGPFILPYFFCSHSKGQTLNIVLYFFCFHSRG